MPMKRFWVGLVLLFLPGFARAQEVASYAVLIGSNEGGEGQEQLAYAEQDAERMRELLAELGRVPRARITLLLRPRAVDVQRSLASLSKLLAAAAARGERSQVVFYYSGHARSHALSLGDEELSLAELRSALRALPSTFTLVVLDACQSGEFSGVKGAAPAADFSARSLSDLTSEGIAVMASSTGSELSQESRRLGASFFTHHLIAALRGAGDADHDGKVSVDEAYRYAYLHTLSDTARTAVGSQHATLETELKGKGQITLSYPVDADARLSLPGHVEGRVLVEARGGAVVAELVKVRGDAVTLALPSGRYQALVRTGSAPVARSCDVQLGHGQTHALSPERCPQIRLDEETGKGAARRERWFAEFGLAGNAVREDAYTRTLEDFRFQRQNKGDDGLGFEGALGYGLLRNLSVVARFDTLEKKAYERELRGPAEGSRAEEYRHFSWATRAVSLGARARLPLWHEWFVPIVELDVGLGVARSELWGEDLSEVQRHYGVALRGVTGFTVGVAEHYGLYTVVGYTFAPVLDNEIGETHDDGGFTLAAGLRMRSLKGWW
jgi:hypothetical protein